MTAAAKPYSYDEVPYSSFPFAESHPDRLSMVARLFGLTPPDIRTARILELGCAAGGNLIPIAEIFPESQSVGVDLSKLQIEAGHQAVAELGLKNVDLRHASILDVDESFGMFDFIICHGVYSWVPDNVQDKILSICKKNLNPTGVAYVSYNTLPGWHMRGMIRDMMRYHASRFGTPQARIGQARALLDFLVQSVGKADTPYGSLLKFEAEILKNSEDWYLYHEHLEEVNTPIYFYEFIQRAQSHGLKFLGESQVKQMVPGNYSSEIEQVLQRLSNDIIHMEQYMDFLRNRMFRHTLLCHSDHELNYAITPDRLLGLYLASPIKPESSNPDLSSTASESFKMPFGTGAVQITDPLGKHALMMLVDAYPQSILFDDLVRGARKRLTPLVAPDEATFQRDVQTLGRMFLYFLVSLVDRLLEARTVRLPLVVTPPEKPKVLNAARRQATQGRTAVNLKHELITLGEFERQLILRLDGTKDRAQIFSEMTDLISSNILVLNVDGQPIRDLEQAKTLMRPALEEALTRFGLHGLLVA